MDQKGWVGLFSLGICHIKSDIDWCWKRDWAGVQGDCLTWLSAVDQSNYMWPLQYDDFTSCWLLLEHVSQISRQKLYDLFWLGLRSHTASLLLLSVKSITSSLRFKMRLHSSHLLMWEIGGHILLQRMFFEALIWVLFSPDSRHSPKMNFSIGV